MLLTFLLLGLAVCATWLKPIPITGKIGIPPWSLFFALSLVSGIAANIVAGSGLLALVFFSGSAYLTARPRAPRSQRVVFGAITMLIALALAMHLLPGFNNPVLIAGVKFSADAASFKQYANFDKGAVGLVLLAFLCKRTASSAELGEAVPRALPVAGLTIVLVMAIAVPIGYLEPDFKLPAFTPVFLLVNLFFTCVAEEAFFRGFLQDRLARLLKKTRWGALIALTISALLFGLAHLGGGVRLALLATIAGVGYAYAYHATKKIEAPILVHFLFNAAHFVFFTYPYLQ
ncbi:MAG: CPBP family intramembrane glutamic endopeptidase [Pseudomonadota bacterium]